MRFRGACIHGVAGVPGFSHERFRDVGQCIHPLEAVALAAFVAVGFMHEESRDAAQALFSGDLRWLFWGGIVGIGLVVPFVLERLSVPEGRRFQLLWTGAFVLAGGLMLRFCVVAAASMM